MSTNLHRGEKKPEIARYITRNAAARKCQLTLGKFSKVCILKGIFPQEPKKNTSNKIYYLKKDIDFLLHDPIIKQVYGLKTLSKKIAKAQHMGEKEKLKKLTAAPPTLNIDHIIKERYPTFLHAVRDLDDALTIIYLFAHQNDSKRILTADHLLCVRLCKEFEAIVVKMRALRKVFVSIKGIYYEAEICGQTVRWLTPHTFVNRRSSDKVDMNIMVSFLVFYKTMLPYVLYKLYNILGLHYPPKLEDGNESSVSEILKDFARQEDQKPKQNKSTSTAKVDKAAAKKIASLNNEELIELDEAAEELEASKEVKETEQEKEAVTAEVEKEFDVARDQFEAESDAITKLFEGRKFFLSREVSRPSLELVIRSFGGLVSWEGPDAPFPESDTDIDYHIADRSHPKKKFFGRLYVQPQWVFDSVNEKILLPADQYALDATLPAHLSPFVFDATHKTYVPERRKYLDKLKIAMERGEEVASDEEEDEEAEGFAPDEEIENEAEARYNREIQAEIQGEEYDEQKAKQADRQLKKKIEKQTKAKEAKDKERAETEGLLMMSNQKRATHVWLKGVEKRAQAKIDVLETKKRKLNDANKSKKKKKTEEE